MRTPASPASPGAGHRWLWAKASGRAGRRGLPEWNWASCVAMDLCASCTWWLWGHSGHNRTLRSTPGGSPCCLSPLPPAPLRTPAAACSLPWLLSSWTTPQSALATPLPCSTALRGSLGLWGSSRRADAVPRKAPPLPPPAHLLAPAMLTSPSRRVWGSRRHSLPPCAPCKLLRIPQNPAQLTHPSMPTLSCP